MGVPEKLRKLRKEAGLKQDDLASFLGVSKTMISKYETGKSEPPFSSLQKLATFYKVGLDSFLEGDNITQTAAHIESKVLLSTDATILHPIPVISWIQAGEAKEISDPYPPGCGSRDVLTDCRDESCFALEVVGCSMSPRFMPGDTIIVSPGMAWHSGALVIARILDDDGVYKATFKRLKIEGEPPDAAYKLIPINPSYPERVLGSPPGEHWQVIGVVIDMKPNLNGKNGC